jgi:peptidoglycan/LPS O-acetylase OafA/YrhL
MASYRKDIEGLRAFCVMAVVLYHAKVPGFTGGFIGVDVFFVISGYLISRLLIAEWLTSGTIDAMAFWGKRARRLLPNALLTITATLITAAIVMNTSDIKELDRDAVSALAYFANYRFAARSGDYFDQDLNSSPLLHYWSLSVEEHFYIIIPIIILLATRFSKSKTLPTMLFSIIAVASFVISLYWMRTSIFNAFYHTEARVWQIAVGGCLASAELAGLRYTARPEFERSRWLLKQAAALILAFYLVGYGSNISYPGFWALPPTLAAAVFIGCSSPSWIDAVLELPAIQWIGSRSYSIYLWHWPILTLAPKLLPASPYTNVICMALILPVAALAYTYVEQPLRHKHRPMRRDVALRTVGAGIAGCVCVAGLSFALKHYSTIKNPNYAAIARRVSEANRQDWSALQGVNCGLKLSDDRPSTCRYGDTTSRRTAVLFGDSIAQHFVHGVDVAAKTANWGLEMHVRGSCPPVDMPMHTDTTGVLDTTCALWRERVMTHLIATRPDLVILSSRVGRAARRFDPVTGGRLSADVAITQWKAGFARIIQRLNLAGIRVLVIRSTPELQKDFGPACLFDRDEKLCATPRAAAVLADPPDMAVAAQLPGVTTLDFSDVLCDALTCPLTKDGAGFILYRDMIHLTPAASQMLAPAFTRVLTEFKPQH